MLKYRTFLCSNPRFSGTKMLKSLAFDTCALAPTKNVGRQVGVMVVAKPNLVIHTQLSGYEW
jgi:hypothetical protein